MTGTLLAYFPSPPQGVWHLGPLPIRAYALFIITGIVVALLIGDRRWEARGGERGLIYDIALWVVPFGLVGGRLYHLATDWRNYWGPGGAGSGAALRMWDGGLGIWGAVALGVVGRLHRLSTPRGCVARLPRQGCAGTCVRAGHRRLGTISIKSFTAGRPRCRGAWRSFTVGICRDTSIRIHSTVSRRVRWPWLCSRRSSTN